MDYKLANGETISDQELGDSGYVTEDGRIGVRLAGPQHEPMDEAEFQAHTQAGAQARQLISNDLQVTKQNLLVDGEELDPDLAQELDEFRRQSGTQNIDDPSFLAKTLDVPAQAVNGFAGAANAMKDLIFDAGTAGAKLLYVDALGVATNEQVDAAVADQRQATDVLPNNPLGEPKSAVGGFVKPVAQFLAPFGAFSKVKYLQGLGAVSKGMLAGAMADFVSFEEHEKRLSNMVNEVGWGNAVTDYLAADPNDTWAEGRFKNVLEGAGLGVLTEGVFQGVRYIRDARKARVEQATFKTASEQAGQNIRAAAVETDGWKKWISGTLRKDPATPPAPLPREQVLAGASKDVNPTIVISAAERDAAIRTIFGEASNQGEGGWQAVANVLLNRKQAGRWGESLDRIAKAKGQFEPWGNAEARARMEALDPNSAEYKAIADVFDRVAKGELPDNTGGATHFLQRQLQEQLGRKVPKWAKDMLAKVGDHEFFAPDTGPVTGRAGASVDVASGDTLAGFRPNREQIDLATQRRMASANSTSMDELTKGKVFENVRQSGIMDKLNRVTMLQEEEFGKAATAAQTAAKRIESGDLSAADDFLRNEGAAYIELAGHAMDAFQDVARATGFRGHSAPVVKTNEILKMLGEADNMGKAELVKLMAKATDPEQMDTLMKNLERGRAQGHSLGKIMRESFYEIHNNFLLSSLKSLMVDSWSSVAMPLARSFEKLPQSLAGRARVAMGGRPERVYANEAGVLLRSYMGSLFDGFSMMADAMRNGGDMSAISQAIERQKSGADYRSLPYERTKWITAENYGIDDTTHLGRFFNVTGSFVRSVGNFYAAKDAVVGSMLARAERRALAHAKAMSEGLSGSAYEDRVAALLKVADAPLEADAKTLAGNKLVQMAKALRDGDDSGIVGEAIRDRAELAARRGTFTDPASKLAEGFKTVMHELPGGRLIVPFIHTPDRIMARFLERSPFAPMFSNFWREVQAGGRRADEAVGNFSLGVGVMAASWWLATNGLLTGDGPKQAAERDALLRTGWRPRSLKVGDTYYEIGRYAPFTMPMLFAGNMKELYDRSGDDLGQDVDRDVQDYLTMGALGMANTMMGMTWMRGPAEIMDAVSRQDGRALENILNFIGSGIAVPNAVTFFANEVNPVMQQTDSLWEAIQAKAGLTVRPKYDVWGQPIKRDPQTVGYVVPSSYANVTDDKTEQELLAAGFMATRPERRIDGVELDADEYADLMKTLGDLNVKGVMDKLVKSPIWKALPDTAVSGIEGAQNQTRAGLAQYIYNSQVKVAREIVKSRNATLQRRILNFQRNLQTQPAATNTAGTVLQSQGVPTRAGPLTVDFGIGQNGNNP